MSRDDCDRPDSCGVCHGCQHAIASCKCDPYYLACQALDEASIALRYCADDSERPRLRAAKLKCEQRLAAIVDAAADQDIAGRE